MVIRVVDVAVGAQRYVDFVVTRQLPRIRNAGLTRGFFLGERVVFNPVLGHDARGEVRNMFAGSASHWMSAHNDVRCLEKLSLDLISRLDCGRRTVAVTIRRQKFLVKIFENAALAIGIS